MKRTKSHPYISLGLVGGWGWIERYGKIVDYYVIYFLEFFDNTLLCVFSILFENKNMYVFFSEWLVRKIYL